MEFSLRNVLTADQGRMLEEGSLDLGFLRMPFAGSPGVDVVPIHQEPFVMVVPSSHPLARKSGLRLRETANETYVLYERAHARPWISRLGVRNSQSRQCNPGGIPGRWGMPMLISLIASGVGISLLPVSAVKISTAGSNRVQDPR